MSTQDKKISNSKISHWKSAENEYRALREKYFKDIPAYEVGNSPFVFAERQTVTHALTRIKLFELVRETQGAIVECGVHKGNALFLYAHLSTILEPYNFNRKVIGFDTFEGFRSLHDNDDPINTENDFSDTNFEMLKKWALLHDLNRAISQWPKIELVRGDAANTIPKYVEDNPHLIIALLYLDFDIYTPTAVALKHLLPLVPRGGVVGFDEVNVKRWQGETIALKESLTLGEIKLRKFYFDAWVSYYIVE
jgi:hypothetical protein